MDLGKVFKHLGVGGIPALGLFARGQPKHLEQDVAELLGGIHVELLAGKLEDLRSQALDFLARGRAQLRETLDVDGRAGALHDGEHRHKRQVDIEISALRTLVLKGAGERADQGARSGSLRGCALLFGFRHGQHAAHIGVEQHIVGILGHRGVQDVPGKPQVEGAHGHELPIVDQRGKGVVGRIDAMHRRLDIDCGEVTAGDQTRKLGERHVVGEHGAALRSGHRHDRPAAEQRLLLGIDDGNAHLLARFQDRIHKLLGLFAVQDLANLNGS